MYLKLSISPIFLGSSARWAAAWVALAVFFTVIPVRAGASPEDSPTADECIALHVDGQAQRMKGRFAAAAHSLRQCLHPQCSPVLRADCAALLQAVERETPTVVLAAKAGEIDLVDVTVTVGGRLLMKELNGRPVPLDAGPLELLFEAEGMQPMRQHIVVHAGEKNRMVSVELVREKGDDAPASVALPSSPAETAASTSDRPSFASRIDAWDYALLGTGLSAAGAGLYTGLSARRDLREAEQCAPLCSQKRGRAIRRKAIIADSLFALSAITLLTVTLRVALRKPSGRSAKVLVGPLFLGGEMCF